MPSEFAKRIEVLTDEQKLHFYALLACNLTISIRGVWSNSDISDAEKLDQIKWINELSHRVTAKAFDITSQTDECTEDDMLNLVEWVAAENPRVKHSIYSAVPQSYEYVTNNQL